MAGTWERIEDRVQAFTSDRARMARYFQIAYWISMIVVVLGAALVIAHYARAGSASSAAGPDAFVSLEATSGGAWNGQSMAIAHGGSALVWLPPDARLHATVLRTANGTDLPTTWRAEGPSAIRIASPVPEDGGTLVATFDVPPPSATRLTLYVAPQDIKFLLFNITPPNGKAVLLIDGASDMRDVKAGAGVSIRIVDINAVGEIPLLGSVVLVGVLALAGSLAWHAVHPAAPRDRSKMRFFDHLGELQARLIPPIVVFAFLNVFYFVAGLRLVHVGRVALVVPWLTDRASLSQQAYDALAERLVPAGVELVALRPIDAVLAQVQVALFLAFVSVLPLLVYEIIVFVAPALRERERRIALRTLPVISLLFSVGALFGYLVMAPLMLRTLYAYAPAVGARPFLVVGDLVSFALLIVASFGIAFELPVVMYVLSRLGVVKARTFWKYFRHAVLAIFIVAGIITPDPSVVSQLLVGVPVTVLYALGMLAAALGERSRGSRGTTG